MNPFDIIVLAILVLSGLFAFARGFVREVLSIAAWIVAGYVAIYFFHAAQPTVRGMIHAAWIADLVTWVGLFVASLVVMSLLVSTLSARVRGSYLGGLDRILGLLFGLGRAALVLCLGYLILARLVPQDTWSPWVTEARSLPLIAAGADQLERLIPRSLLDRGTQAVDRTSRAVGNASDAAEAVQRLERTDPFGHGSRNEEFDALRRPPAPRANGERSPGYDADAERQMDRAVQSVGSERR